MFERLKIRNYFRKIKKKTMTLEEAARKLGCSEGKLRVEYLKYCNPYQVETTAPKPHIGGLITIIISLFALILAAYANQIAIRSNEIAINANKIETNPELKVEDKSVTLYWNGEGELVYTDYGIIGDNFYQDETSISVPGVSVRNVGRATAKNIVYDWNYEKNLEAFSEKFNDIGLYMDFDIIKQNNDTILKIYEEDLPCEYSSQPVTGSYIATEEEAYISIPIVYVDLLARYCFGSFPSDDKVDYSRWGIDEKMPQVELTITYYNAYDEEKKDDICMKFKPVNYRTMDGKAGACTLQISTEYLGTRL